MGACRNLISLEMKEYPHCIYCRDTVGNREERVGGDYGGIYMCLPDFYKHFIFSDRSYSSSGTWLCLRVLEKGLISNSTQWQHLKK